MAPSPFQAQVLELFEQALECDDEGLLDRVYEVALNHNCNLTLWSTPEGESVDTAYARRKEELQDQLAAVAS
jgi:hypothetical protein